MVRQRWRILCGRVGVGDLQHGGPAHRFILPDTEPHAPSRDAQLPGHSHGRPLSQLKRQNTHCPTPSLGRAPTIARHPQGGCLLSRLQSRTGSTCILVRCSRIRRDLSMHEPQHDLETTRMTTAMTPHDTETTTLHDGNLQYMNASEGHYLVCICRSVQTRDATKRSQSSSSEPAAALPASSPSSGPFFLLLRFRFF